jgi:hypothetical protein
VKLDYNVCDQKNRLKGYTMKLHFKFTLIFFVSLLGACGGGGGSGSLTAASYSLEGFAAKGTLKFATVEVYKLDSNGNQTLVKSGETLDDGTYKIPDVGVTAGQKYIIKIKPNIRTVHVDELLGNQTLPADFELTAFTQTDSATTTASVTPFSHMMVEAAKNAQGGLTAANISQAQITITELLGFNPITVAKNDGVSNDAKKLIVLLTAVSQMAKDGAFGCTSGAAADKTKCVINALAAGTSSTSLKLETRLGSQTFNVSCVIATAISKTLQDAKFQSQSPLLAQVLNKFKCG